MNKLFRLSSIFLKLSEEDKPAPLMDDPRANRVFSNFLIVKKDHPKYHVIVDATKKILTSASEEASDLLTMYILNSFDMPDITPSHDMDEKILLIKDLLTEDDLVRILNDLRFKAVKPFMKHPSEKVRQVAFSRLGVRDKDSDILELENLRYLPGFNKEEHRRSVLLRMLNDNMVEPSDMLKLLEYFSDITAPFHEYFTIFKQYAKSLSKSEAAMILEKYNLPVSWKKELQIAAGVPVKEKPSTIEDLHKGLKKLDLMYGKQDKKLN